MQKERDFDVSEEREMLARGLKEKVAFSRITLNNQETREKETQQQEKKNDLVGHLLHTSVSTRLLLPVGIFPQKVDRSV